MYVLKKYYLNVDYLNNKHNDFKSLNFVFYLALNDSQYKSLFFYYGDSPILYFIHVLLLTCCQNMAPLAYYSISISRDVLYHVIVDDAAKSQIYNYYI